MLRLKVKARDSLSDYQMDLNLSGALVLFFLNVFLISSQLLEYAQKHNLCKYFLDEKALKYRYNQLLFYSDLLSNLDFFLFAKQESAFFFLLDSVFFSNQIQGDAVLHRSANKNLDVPDDGKIFCDILNKFPFS